MGFLIIFRIIVQLISQRKFLINFLFSTSSFCTIFYFLSVQFSISQQSACVPMYLQRLCASVWYVCAFLWGLRGACVSVYGVHMYIYRFFYMRVGHVYWCICLCRGGMFLIFGLVETILLMEIIFKYVGISLSIGYLQCFYFTYVFIYNS